ncbi:MAG: hypothetical protein AABW47_03700 [Nanoarchaeota archaeon]
MYNPEKIKKFHEYTLEDYNRSLIIEDIVRVNLVEKTDEKFIQIGIRPLLGDEIFTSESFDPRLPSIGMMVSNGEVDYLIKTIIDKADKKEIEKIEFKEDIKEFPKYIYQFDDSVILLSTKFFVEVFTKLMNRIDYEEKHPRLDKRYKIIPISEKILGNKIIIIDKNAILWDKEIFEDKITGSKEKIDITIKPASIGKVDITIRSVNKIKDIDSDLIKVLEIVEESLK